MSTYLIVEFDVTDEEAYREYQELTKPTLVESKAKPVVLGKTPLALEGDWHSHIVVLEFADADAAQSWYESPGYRPARAVASKAMERRMAIVEGME